MTQTQPRPFSIGILESILDKKHADRLGGPLMLYMWCIRHQTGRAGFVLGGAPISYAKINERLGQPERTLKRWMKALLDWEYIEVSYLNHKAMRIRITKPKKPFAGKGPKVALSTESSKGHKRHLLEPKVALSGPHQVPEVALPSRDLSSSFRYRGESEGAVPELGANTGLDLSAPGFAFVRENRAPSPTNSDEVKAAIEIRRLAKTAGVHSHAKPQRETAQQSRLRRTREVADKALRDLQARSH